MITFNIGPSKISENTKKDIQAAVKENIMEISHRGPEFTDLSRLAAENLRQYFRVPDDYRVFFTASATMAMQLALANCCQERSFHYVSGNFSNLFARISLELGLSAATDRAGPGELNDFSKPAENEPDFVALTHCETSTGVMCRPADIETVRKNFPNAVLAADITSTAGAVELDIGLADIWLFSVQKCLGLPPGLGVMIVSGRALERAEKVNQARARGFFTFERMADKMKDKYQTLYTPNILAIYLLGRKLGRWLEDGGPGARARETGEKYNHFDRFIHEAGFLRHFVAAPESRANTLFCLQAGPETIQGLHRHGREHGIILGQGYGRLKPTTLRIANFPALKTADFDRLIDILNNY